jgi:hypothetical protein
LYREGITVLYGKPLFSFVTKLSSLQDEVKFFSASIAEHVAFVRRIEIYGPDHHDKQKRTMLLPELVTFLPNLRNIIIRSHQYGNVQKGSMEDMRVKAQESGRREPEWQSKAGLVDIFIRKPIFFGACCLLKVRPLPVT